MANPNIPVSGTSIGETLSEALDYKGRPALRSRTGGWTAAAMILVVELNERLTSLGISVNLVTYLTGTMHLGNAVSANIITNFVGTYFMLCLLSGFLADTFLGRYHTIVIFTAVQATPPETQLAVLYLSLYVTALGTGGLKSSVSGLGSDQFDEKNPEEKHQMMIFFNWFFFFINLGSLLAVTVLVYIQDEKGRPWGYGINAAIIVIGFVVFLSGKRRYRYKRIMGSPITQIAAVLVGAWRNRGLELPSHPSLLYEIKSGVNSMVKPKLPHTSQFICLDRAAIVDSEKPPMSKWKLSTVTDIEEVKMMIRMLPIWATTIIFWTVYAQMGTFSVSQATTMNRSLSSSFQIPAGSLTVFFVASTLLTIPIYDRIIVPITRRFTANPQGMSPLQRIGVGLVLATLAMVSAALTERRRRNVAWSGASPMSVFWLTPQFLLVGSGEAFTYIGQLDFFLRECPAGMKTISTGLFLSTLALGFFLSSGLVSAVHAATGKSGWLADNLNYGKLDY
ncbi:hypothetical protein J5N97_006580 [Dioscorea zingiberensis]|uniref:Uncharacterized protein n=1 Tax=Dioscorea zingiberensis TaxID=325984 RepID=A0A9D5DBM7_9LILI|nr:hypothetical protein J5N97_006580 [Dioscorea zingiberensis]